MELQKNQLRTRRGSQTLIHMPIQTNAERVMENASLTKMIQVVKKSKGHL